MQILTRRPALRWFAPLALVVAVAGTGIVATTADAGPKLSPKTADELLVDLQGARVDGLSGTVVQQADLGLPALPTTGGADATDLTSLLSGKHTLKVWYAGPDKARFALVDRPLSETNVIVDGSDVWTWSSAENEGTHRTLTEPSGTRERREAPEEPMTPQKAAEEVLEAVGPTTEVSTDSAVEVAGRPARELVLRPRDTRSLITSVKVAVDDATSVPLRVQVLGAEDRKVAEIGFTTVDFAVPDDGQFEFNPPAGAEVTEEGAVEPKGPSEADREAAQDKAAQLEERTEVVGEGWTQVVVTEVPADATGELGAFVNSLEQVSGTWGSGRLLSGTAFTAVLTDDGRLAVGAVPRELLFEALAK